MVYAEKTFRWMTFEILRDINNVRVLTGSVLTVRWTPRANEVYSSSG